jgi:nitrogenase subunit NifH
LNCPHCGQVIDLFGVGGGDRTAREMNIAFLGRIPMDPRMVSCGDSGVSFQQTYPDSAATKAFRDIAEQMAQVKDAG